MSRLESLDSFPFRNLIDANLGASSAPTVLPAPPSLAILPLAHSFVAGPAYSLTFLVLYLH